MRYTILAGLSLAALSLGACTIQPAPAPTPVIITAPAPAQPASTIVVPRSY